jgi:DNA mismatch repair protein MutS
MTEMIEVASILHNATNRSFIVFDEIWRGTSTFDGLALSQAILEYTATTIWARCLVATHYHELIDLANHYPAIRNFCVWVYEKENTIIFLKQIIPWWADKSYGIYVADRAWIPTTIIHRATHVLEQLHWSDTVSWNKVSTNNQQSIWEKHHHWLFDTSGIDPSSSRGGREILDILQTISIETTTPLQALTTLAYLIDKAKKEK